MRKISAVVLAGTHQDPRRLVHGQNKALLPVGGQPLLGLVVDALRAAPSIGTIVIVGPEDLIRERLPNLPAEITVVPQGGSLTENAWRGYVAAAAGVKQPRSEELPTNEHGPALHMMEQTDPVDQVLAEIARTMDESGVRALPVQAAQVLLTKQLRRNYRLDGPFSRMPGAPLDRRFWSHPGLRVGNGQVSFDGEERFSAYLQLSNWLNEIILYVPGDIPLLTAEAVEDFLRRCGPMDKDYYFGLVREEDLEAYYPRDGRPGIVRPYVHLREARVRLFNLNLVKPKLISQAWLVKSGFDLRKMVHWSNVAQSARVLARLRGRFRALFYLTMLQSAAVCRRRGLKRTALFFAGACPTYGLEFYLSRLLGTELALVLTPFGGPSIDVDNAEDYAIIQQNFDQWRAVQTACAERLGLRRFPEVMEPDRPDRADNSPAGEVQ